MEKTQTYCRRSNDAFIRILFFIIECILFAHCNEITPLITPNQPDITVLPNQNIKLICHATEPIHWHFHKAFFGDYEVHMSFNRTLKYPYESVLELNSVDFTYVHYYYCVKKSAKPNDSVEHLVNTKQAARIYLFVEDRKHPLVRVSIPLFQGKQNDEIIVPCKPTSKNFDVRLIQEGNNGSHQMESSFNPTEGFRIKLKSIADAGRYVCHATFDTAEKFDIYFTVEVDLSKPEPLNEPKIVSKSNDNGQLEFNCSIETEGARKLRINWSLPNRNIAIEEGRVQIMSPILEKLNITIYQTLGKLVVNKLNKTKDIGPYTCLVEDNFENRISATVNINQVTEFIRPQLTMSDVFYNVGENVNPTCEIISYPMSSISWSFTPCEEIEFSLFCDESRQITFDKEKIKTIQQSPFKQTSILNITPGGMGVVICEASNSVGKSEARANINFNDLNDDFSIWHENEEPIIAGDNVTLICGASAFEYTELYWYKDDVPVGDTIDVQVITNNTQYSQRKEIHWHSIDAEASGNYTCRVKLIKSDTYLNKSWELNVVQPTLPVIQTNIKPGQTQKHSLGEHIELLCKCSGLPLPKITWYKNDNEIQPDAKLGHISLLENDSKLHIQLNENDEGWYKCVAANRAGSTLYETNVLINGNRKENKAFIYGLLPVMIIVICVICTILCTRFRR